MPSHFFLVNSETNKQWKYRLQLVEELSVWVKDHLNPVHVKWNPRKVDKKGTEAGRIAKAHQYVYEFLAVGKMEFPVESADVSDPLFTTSFYTDKSMELQLTPGAYEDFMATVKQKHKSLLDFNPADHPSISWSDTQEGMSETTKQLLAKMRDDLIQQGYKDDEADEQMTGLVLRYKCVGAFSDNLHGSVPSDWLHILGETCVECFASPFNHKFHIYYSIFEQDRVFGSQGNFFAMMAKNDNVLPEHAIYEINPPWNNQMYETVHKILEKTLINKKTVRVVIVGPNWTDTRWIPDINLVMERFKSYSLNSKHGTNFVQYVNDIQSKTFVQDTVYWFFSTTQVTEEILIALKLVRQRATRSGSPGPDRSNSPGPARRSHTSIHLDSCPYTYSLLYSSNE